MRKFLLAGIAALSVAFLASPGTVKAQGFGLSLSVGRGYASPIYSDWSAYTQPAYGYDYGYSVPYTTYVPSYGYSRYTFGPRGYSWGGHGREHWGHSERHYGGWEHRSEHGHGGWEHRGGHGSGGHGHHR